MIALDFMAIALANLYGFFHKPYILALIGVINWKLTIFQNEVFGVINANVYDLTITGQTIMLEKMLNEYYGLAMGTIYIENSILEDEIFIFNSLEDNPEIFIYNTAETAPDEVYLFNQEEEDLIPDFIVKVPATLTFSMVIMKKLIDKHKLAGVIYQIVTY